MSASRLALLGALLSPTLAFSQEPGNPVDSRVSSSFNAAERYQGPLDGSWTVVSASGQALLALQIVDRPGGHSALEGVWRDLRHPPVPGDIGFIDGFARGPGTLTITLVAAPGATAATVSLRADPDGGWSGKLHENGADAPVKLRRQ